MFLSDEKSLRKIQWANIRSGLKNNVYNLFGVYYIQC